MLIRIGHLRLIALTAMLALLLAIGAACGGGDDGDEPEPTETVGAAATEPEATSGPSTDSIAVDQDFWHAGWKVTLGEATLGADSLGIQTVTFDAVFENLGMSPSSFNSQLALVSAGNAFADSGIDQDLPNVPAGLTGNGTIVIQVDESFTLDDATLIVGNPENNQAVVPIGPDSPDELVSLEPLALPVTGSSAAGPVAFTVTGVEVRADLPDWSDQVEQGSLALIVSFEVTPGNGIPLGQGVIGGDNLALRLPDGTAVSVRSDGRSGVNELLQGRENTTIMDLSARFIIPEPAEGSYAFLVRGTWGPDITMVDGEVPFDVPEYVSDPP